MTHLTQRQAKFLLAIKNAPPMLDSDELRQRKLVPALRSRKDHEAVQSLWGWRYLVTDGISRLPKDKDGKVIFSPVLTPRGRAALRAYQKRVANEVENVDLDKQPLSLSPITLLRREGVRLLRFADKIKVPAARKKILNLGAAYYLAAAWLECLPSPCRLARYVPISTFTPANAGQATTSTNTTMAKKKPAKGGKGGKGTKGGKGPKDSCKAC